MRNQPENQANAIKRNIEICEKLVPGRLRLRYRSAKRERHRRRKHWGSTSSARSSLSFMLGWLSMAGGKRAAKTSNYVLQRSVYINQSSNVIYCVAMPFLLNDEVAGDSLGEKTHVYSAGISARVA